MNFKPLFSALVLVMLAGCGGGSTQQFLINWDNQTTISVSRANATCAEADTQNATDVTQTDAESSMVIAVYQGDASTASKPYYADFGTRTLAGTKSSSGAYSLSDAQVTHNTTDSMDIVDDSDTVTVNMTVTGGFVSGTWSEEKYHSDTSTTTGCLYSTKFRGQQISASASVSTVNSPGDNH